MWDKKIYNFGDAKPKQVIKAEFNYLGDKEISQIKAACGCTLVEYTKGSNKVILEYTVGDFPNHLKNTDTKRVDVSKTATVKFKDSNSEDILILKGSITNK
jgi:hypothetical protein